MSKKCACCGRILDESCFSKNLRNSDGLHSYCKKCNAMKAKQYNLTKGKKMMSGVLERQRASGYFRFGHGAYVNMKRSAAKRNITFDLTEIQLRDWWLSTENKCFYCGCNVEEFIKYRDFIKDYSGDSATLMHIKSHVFNKENYYKIVTMTIDRVDSNLGYFVQNLVKACWICNSIKSNIYSEDEMKILAKNIRKEIEDELNKCGK